uniref:Uncharacterized protein n=1 Tax=Octopus bimaculoides TaxID=37653 RepID=A0A0L8FGY6_OCTBM
MKFIHQNSLLLLIYALLLAIFSSIICLQLSCYHDQHWPDQTEADLKLLCFSCKK